MKVFKRKDLIDSLNHQLSVSYDIESWSIGITYKITHKTLLIHFLCFNLWYRHK